MVTVQMSYENLGNFPRFEIALLQLNLTAFPTIKKPNLQQFDIFLINEMTGNGNYYVN